MIQGISANRCNSHDNVRGVHETCQNYYYARVDAIAPWFSLHLPS